MTLCVAWVRQADNNEELVFATDSALTGGEKWNSGIKLFELPRKDCLLCFAGSTFRAYPLVLHLISSIRFNAGLQNPHTDIVYVLEYLSELFTNLVKGVISEIAGEDIHELRSGAKFLFGGWSWQENRFRIWELYYEKVIEGFIYKEHSASEKSRIASFLGDPEPIVGELARDAYKKLMIEGDFDRKLDMEPIIVLRNLARDKAIREVDGSLQVAKVYRSGTSEFFGVYWPSVAGLPCLQGQEFKHFDKPGVRYFDPDTFEVMEEQLPEYIGNLDALSALEDFVFIKDCYPDGTLKDDLSERERDRLLATFQAHSYREFINDLKKALTGAYLQERQEG
ncbi:MAG: hypothetical protein C0392_00940 [Syntrophus sp. (in: bacteria)]|nr:hypothetical protein [Syntrophus sp. (in: bacteria)]